MASLDLATVAPKVAQAKSAGYSDDEIVNFLSEQAPDQFKQAKDAGYSAGEILSHLTAAQKAAAPKADDQGYARRQAMTAGERIISPITEYPRVYDEMLTEARHQVGRGVEQLQTAIPKAGGLWEPGQASNLWEGVKGIGNVVGGSLGVTFNVPLAALRTQFGNPVQDLTGIPREYTEFGAQLALPGVGFSKLPKAPGVAEPVPLIRPVETPMQRPDVVEAANRVNEISPVSVPRAVTGSRTEQQFGQNISNIPAAGQPISEAIHTRLPQQLERARDVIAAEQGAGTGENVANRVGVSLQEQVAAEKAAAEAEAARVDAQATAEWRRAQAEREAAIAQREQQAATAEQQSGQTAQQVVGPDLHPQDMGEVVINRTRAAHDAAEARKNALYEEAGNLDARISDEANALLHHEADLGISREGMDLRDVEATGASRAMMDRLREFSERARQRPPLAPVGQSIQEVEQLRQNLNFLARGVRNDADRHAAQRILHHFDEWYGNAAENHLMPGSDPRAPQAMLDARAANRDWRQRFGYNSKDEPGKLINKIVRGEQDQFTGPVGVSDALTKGGDTSGPLFTQVMRATGNNPDVAQAIRSGTWNKLTRDARGQPLDPKDIQKNVTAHLYGKARDVAERAFTQEQRDLMRAHADTVVQSETQRAAAAADRKAAEKLTKSTEPTPTKVEAGPIQQLTEQVIGGKTSDEALFRTLHGYAKKGGDVKTLARVMQQLPPGMRGDLGSAFIREMGVSPTTKQFSLDHFVNHWNGLSDQAKAVMFGNAGPHVTALNDIATIAQRLKEVKGRFGNPSGTAQNVLFTMLGGLGTQSLKAAAVTAATGVGANVAARVLASPAGASSVVKYARAVERANRVASPANAVAVKLAQRNLENTARSITAISGKQQ